MSTSRRSFLKTALAAIVCGPAVAKALTAKSAPKDYVTKFNPAWEEMVLRNAPIETHRGVKVMPALADDYTNEFMRQWWLEQDRKLLESIMGDTASDSPTYRPVDYIGKREIISDGRGGTITFTDMPRIDPISK